MQHIKEFVENFLKKSRIGEQKEEDIIFSGWSSIVGDEIAGSAEPFKFSDGKLFLYVKNSALMNELTYRKKDIKMAVNKVFREEKVKEIILKIKQ